MIKWAMHGIHMEPHRVESWTVAHLVGKIGVRSSLEQPPDHADVALARRHHQGGEAARIGRVGVRAARE